MTTTAIKNHTVWIDKQGKEHLITKMTTSHILNCLRMCWRNPGWRTKIRQGLLNELEARGLKETNPEYFV